jgi:hypothetical protein
VTSPLRLKTGLDARAAHHHKRIASQSAQMACLFMQAVCALVAIAMVHSDNRLASIREEADRATDRRY